MLWTQHDQAKETSENSPMELMAWHVTRELRNGQKITVTKQLVS